MRNGSIVKMDREELTDMKEIIKQCKNGNFYFKISLTM